MKTIIRPRRIIDGTGAPPLEGGAVVVEGGKIRWVGPAAELGDSYDAVVAESPTGTLLPGLIDAHVHLMCRGEGWRARQYQQTSDAELLLTAVANAQVGLRAGVTTMRDVGSRGFLMVELREAIKAGRLAGPRLLVSGPSITTTGGHFHYLGMEADTAEQLVSTVRALCKGGVDFIKVMATGGNSTPGTNARAPQYSAEQVHAIVEDAHRLSRRVAAHVHGVGGIRNCVAAEVDTLEHCTWLGERDGVRYDEKVAREIVDRGIYVSLAMPARFRLPPEATDDRMTPEQRATNALREARFAAIRDMVALGARIVASSDSGMALTHPEDFSLLLETMVNSLGMSPLATIRAATQTAADALGIAGEVGTIEVGKRADLILVDGDPTEEITALGCVSEVFRDGKRVAAARGSTGTGRHQEEIQ